MVEHKIYNKNNVFTKIANFAKSYVPFNNPKKFNSHQEKEKHIEMRRFRMKAFTFAGVIGIYALTGLYRHYMGSEEDRMKVVRSSVLKSDEEDIMRLKEELKEIKERRVESPEKN